MRRKAAGVTLAVVFLILGSTRAALASCAAPEGTFRDRLLEGAAVFVGFVNQTSNNGRTAEVTIQEVWRAGDLPLSAAGVGLDVKVNGNPLTEAFDPNIASSIDRHYERGVPYLFVPDIGNRGDDGVISFRESACSATTEFTRSIEKYRPFTVEPAAVAIPDPSPEPGEPLPDWSPTAVVVILAVLSAAFSVVRRWRSRGRPAF